MALIAHQTQGPFSSHSPSFKASTRRASWGSSTVQFNYKTHAFVPLKHHLHFRERPIFSQRRKAFRVFYFKSNTQNDGPERRSSKISRSPIQISGMQQGREDVLSESHDVQKHPLSYSSEEKDSTTVRSLAIQKLFRKWLIMLRTQTSNQTMDANPSETAAQCATSESQHEIMGTKVGKVLKAALVYFLGLDAAISIPLVIFIPWYLTVKVVYGAEVTKELTPLWILGPPVVALYVKIIQGLCSLYILFFSQAVKLIKNLPRYSLSVYSYLAEGKLRAYLWAHFVKPMIDVKNLDYRALSREKYKQLKAWAVEKYLDFLESIWPHYCRTIRFLKKANFI